MKDILKHLFNIKKGFHFHFNKYPACKRECCFCVKTMNLKDKRMNEIYSKCYRSWNKGYY